METAEKKLLLAPLRGVTIRAFRTVFADAIAEAGFTGAVAPFIPANAGFKYTKKLFTDLLSSEGAERMPLIPQVIGKDPAALREWCKAVKDLGFTKADLNAGCPFPMIRKKGRGSGLIRSPDTLERMLEAGCDEMGAGNFSLKTRLGVDRPDELDSLMPAINRYPLAFLTIHARTAKQMYEGTVDKTAFERVKALSKIPVIYNGDAGVEDAYEDGLMVGRRFIRSLGLRPDARELLSRYIEASKEELSGEAPVLGRIKELLSYWCMEKQWSRRWAIIKICRSIAELESAVR